MCHPPVKKSQGGGLTPPGPAWGSPCSVKICIKSCQTIQKMEWGMYRINDAYTTWIQLYHFDVAFEVAFYIRLMTWCTVPLDLSAVAHWEAAQRNVHVSRLPLWSCIRSFGTWKSSSTNYLERPDWNWIPSSSFRISLKLLKLWRSICTKEPSHKIHHIIILYHPSVATTSLRDWLILPYHISRLSPASGFGTKTTFCSCGSLCTEHNHNSSSLFYLLTYPSTYLPIITIHYLSISPTN